MVRCRMGEDAAREVSPEISRLGSDDGPDEVGRPGNGVEPQAYEVARFTGVGPREDRKHEVPLIRSRNSRVLRCSWISREYSAVVFT